MGIPGFNSWVRREYPEAFFPLERGQRVDHLYVDLASTLHTVLRKSRTPSQFHRRLHARLDNYLAALRPCKRVVLALDGPAPLAKLLEQRRRRSKLRPPSGEDKSQGTSSDEEAVDVLCPLALTPGTPFMLSVHASLLVYISRRLANPRNRRLVFEFSDSTVQGEGELKLLAKLQRRGQGHGAPVPGDVHVILGGDSDLYLIALVSRHPSVFIAADADIPYSGSVAPVPAFSREALARAWGADPADADVAMLGLDLCLLAVLASGNDYLPAIQGLALTSRERPGLWQLFLDLRRQAGTAAGAHLWQRTRCGDLALNRGALAALLWRTHEQRRAGPDRSADGGGNGGGAQQRGRGSWSFGPEAQPVPAEVMDRSPRPILAFQGPPDAERYARGLEWVVNMYGRGVVSDYRFTYDLAAPSVLALVACLGGAGADGAAAHAVPATVKPPMHPVAPRPSPFPPGASGDVKTRPLVPAACALATLPLSGRRYAATALRHLMDDAASAPLGRLFASCPDCARFGAAISEANRELAAARASAAQPAPVPAQRAGPGGAQTAPTRAARAAAQASAASRAAEVEALGMLTRLAQAQTAHMEEAHPFSPFPVEDVETAVARVPLRDYPPLERPLASFGRDLQLRYSHSQLASPRSPPSWWKPCTAFLSAYPAMAQRSNELPPGVVCQPLQVSWGLPPGRRSGGPRARRPDPPSAVARTGRDRAPAWRGSHLHAPRCYAACLVP